MRVLVTGAYGMLGEVLVPILRANGLEVRSHGRRPGCEVICDLTDPAATQRMLDREKPVAVINLAALASVDQCEERPLLAFQTNVQTVENIASAISGLSEPPHLVHISTDHVYDGARLSAEQDVRPLNVYAITKYAGDLAAGRIGATILRTSFFGRSRSGGRSSLSDWVEARLREGQPFPAFADVFFTPLRMDTLSELIVGVVRARRPGVYNLGSRGSMSKAAFAEELARLLGHATGTIRRVSIASAGLKADRPKNMSMDCSRFEQSFGVRLPALIDQIHGLVS